MTPEVEKAIRDSLAENQVLSDLLQLAKLAAEQGRFPAWPLMCPAGCGFPDQGELAQDAVHCPACGTTLVEQRAAPDEYDRASEEDRLTADQPPKGENFLKPSRRSGGRLDGQHIEQRKPYKKARLL
jgi:predicted Zn-ribbon and HTH transcriptional regulator